MSCVIRLQSQVVYHIIIYLAVLITNVYFDLLIDFVLNQDDEM